MVEFTNAIIFVAAKSQFKSGFKRHDDHPLSPPILRDPEKAFLHSRRFLKRKR